MQFLNPIWLFALAALSIPLLIHLWNVRPGKTLKVGSISLITKASKSTRRSFKLLDILLLVVRCLLLACLAMFLAGPAWRYFSAKQAAKGWVLIPKENFRETYSHFKPQVDSLTARGYEFHYFNKDFGKADIKKLLTDTTLKGNPAKANYWGLIKQLDRRASAQNIVVFTPNAAKCFTGDKPKVALNLHWQTYTQEDSVSKWIAAAVITDNGSIKVTEGISTPQGNTFTERFLNGDGNAEITINVQNGRPSVSLRGQPAVPVDTATTRIAIYTDKYQLDAKYLRAALDAAVSFSYKKAVIKQYSDPSQIPAGQTWLFWLSDKPVAAKLAKNIFKYESGRSIETKTWIVPEQIPLRRIVSTITKGSNIWGDGAGNPVLTQTGTTYHFYSRFNPAWGDMVWNEAFPKMMLDLLSTKLINVPALCDKTVLNNAQVQPGLSPEPAPLAKVNEVDDIDVSRYFWWALTALFGAERLLSYKTKQTTDG